MGGNPNFVSYYQPDDQNDKKAMTIAQQLKIKEFPFVIKDNKGNKIYHEKSTGHWVKIEYNEKGKKIYFEDSKGYWVKFEYDDEGKEIYWEQSDGRIVDRRPKPWRQDLITQMEEMVSRLEEDGLYALQGIRDRIKELKK